MSYIERAKAWLGTNETTVEEVLSAYERVKHQLNNPSLDESMRKDIQASMELLKEWLDENAEPELTDGLEIGIEKSIEQNDTAPIVFDCAPLAVDEEPNVAPLSGDEKRIAFHSLRNQLMSINCHE